MLEIFKSPLLVIWPCPKQTQVSLFYTSRIDFDRCRASYTKLFNSRQTTSISLFIKGSYWSLYVCPSWWYWGNTSIPNRPWVLRNCYGLCDWLYRSLGLWEWLVIWLVICLEVFDWLLWTWRNRIIGLPCR